MILFINQFIKAMDVFIPTLLKNVKNKLQTIGNP